MLPAQLPVLYRPIDPEVLSWVAAVRQVSTVTRATILASDAMVRQAKIAGIWEKVYMWDHCAGDDLAASLVRLKVPSSVARAYTNNNFVSADYTETGVNGGRKGNGTSKYLSTQINAITLGFDVSSFGLWAYHREAGAAGTSAFTFGAEDAAGGNCLHLGWSQSGTIEATRIASNNSAAAIGNTGSQVGFVGGNVSGSRQVFYYRNGIVEGSNYTAGQSFPNRNLSAFVNDANGVRSAYSNRRTSHLLLTKGLSANEITALNSIVQAFETALGRNV